MEAEFVAAASHNPLLSYMHIKKKEDSLEMLNYKRDQSPWDKINYSIPNVKCNKRMIMVNCETRWSSNGGRNKNNCNMQVQVINQCKLRMGTRILNIKGISVYCSGSSCLAHGMD